MHKVYELHSENEQLQEVCPTYPIWISVIQLTTKFSPGLHFEITHVSMLMGISSIAKKKGFWLCFKMA